MRVSPRLKFAPFYKRKERDSNPRDLAVYTLSRRASSTTPAPFLMCGKDTMLKPKKHSGIFSGFLPDYHSINVCGLRNRLSNDA